MSTKLRALVESEEHVDFTEEESKKILESLDSCKILDPACGSGAFPMGALQKMVQIIHKLDPHNDIWKQLQIQKISSDKNLNSKDKNELIAQIVSVFDENDFDYGRKLYLIENCIYGVDIQPIAVQIAKLRFFISLIVDQKVDSSKPNYGIRPLPNLENHIVIADSLVSAKKETGYLTSDQTLNLEEELAQIHHKSFSAQTPEIKAHVRKQDRETRKQLEDSLVADGMGAQAAHLFATYDPYNKNQGATFFDAFWMFGVSDGFDIVIGNPPYISTKGVTAENKKRYEAEFGFSDDTYNLFTFKGLQLAKKGGTVNFITPKTFWTTQTKRNMRGLLLGKQLKYIFDTANPFDAVMVDTCIFQVQNKPFDGKTPLRFLDGSKDLKKPLVFEPILQTVYQNTQNAVIFKPTELNLKIWKKYGEKVKELYDEWWDKIETSKKIKDNESLLKKYRESLKPGDVALLGCLTEGGQGLATANNGKYIAVRKSSKWADGILKSRPKKLEDAIKKNKKLAKELGDIDAKTFLAKKSEKEIAELFDSLKEKYGRDIFGQGYIYKLIDDDEIADVETLTKDEKENGISTKKKFYVPYDKGDKDGNRWYLETPFAIAWSKENVCSLDAEQRESASSA